MTFTEKLKMKHFLDELSYLTDKYNIVIKGCGCCGSPYLEDMKETTLGFDLKYIEEKKKYVYKEYRLNKDELHNRIFW